MADSLHLKNNKFSSSSAEETYVIGKKLGESLLSKGEGAIIALYGGLGAGKTVFAKGIAAGIGVEEAVTSPTYTIISEYEAGDGRPFYHIDAYRLRGDDDFEGAGGMEIIEEINNEPREQKKAGIAVIEWAERIPESIPQSAVKIEISILENDKRMITIKGFHTNEHTCDRHGDGHYLGSPGGRGKNLVYRG
jgi:tRNA threonylcarbamoyladenosine biosynthesis protein TsaE